MINNRLKTIGVGAALSIQLLTSTPAIAVSPALVGSDFLGGGGLDFGFLDSLIQSLASDLLSGISIGGIDMSSIITDAVFGSGGLINGGGIDLGGILDSAGGVLQPEIAKLPGGPQIYSFLKDVLDGSFSPQSLLNGGLLEKLLGPLLESILGKNEGLPGGSPSGGILGGGRGSEVPNATLGSGGVLGTGSTTCLYSSTCRPDSNPYKSIYSQATGAQGFPNPNEVRGKIYQEATSERLLSDIYASNPNIGAFYAGNQSDRDITRASTEAHLSKAGQALHKKINDTSKKTVASVGDLVKKCAKESKSSQDLIRCNLLVDGVGPSFDAAQLSVMLQAQKDDQLQKIQLSNISASMDAQRRQRDVENAGLSISSMKAIWTSPDKW